MERSPGFGVAIPGIPPGFGVAIPGIPPGFGVPHPGAWLLVLQCLGRGDQALKFLRLADGVEVGIVIEILEAVAVAQRRRQ